MKVDTLNDSLKIVEFMNNFVNYDANNDEYVINKPITLEVMNEIKEMYRPIYMQLQNNFFDMNYAMFNNFTTINFNEINNRIEVKFNNLKNDLKYSSDSWNQERSHRILCMICDLIERTKGE